MPSRPKSHGESPSAFLNSSTTSVAGTPPPGVESGHIGNNQGEPLQREQLFIIDQHFNLMDGILSSVVVGAYWIGENCPMYLRSSPSSRITFRFKLDVDRAHRNQIRCALSRRWLLSSADHYWQTIPTPLPRWSRLSKALRGTTEQRRRKLTVCTLSLPRNCYCVCT